MPEEKENCTTLYESYDLPISLRDRLKRVDEIHRAITRAVGRIEYLKLSAMRAGSRPTPVRYGQGVERSRVEYAVLESDAERWGIGELQKELDALLQDIRPLVERLPARGCFGPWRPSGFWRAFPAASSAGGCISADAMCTGCWIRPVNGCARWRKRGWD